MDWLENLLFTLITSDPWSDQVWKSGLQWSEISSLTRKKACGLLCVSFGRAWPVWREMCFLEGRAWIFKGEVGPKSLPWFKEDSFGNVAGFEVGERERGTIHEAVHLLTKQCTTWDIEENSALLSGAEIGQTLLMPLGDVRQRRRTPEGLRSWDSVNQLNLILWPWIERRLLVYIFYVNIQCCVTTQFCVALKWEALSTLQDSEDLKGWFSWS